MSARYPARRDASKSPARLALPLALLVLAGLVVALFALPKVGRAQAGPGADTTGASVQSACAPDATRIHEVQGPGASSPLVGTTLTVTGVVVGDYQAADHDVPFGTNLGGFFVQDLQPDDDPRTSEGIFVTDPTNPARVVDVSVGDVVRVTGRVEEADGLTRLQRVSEVVVCASDVSLPAPAALTLPVASLAELEAHEGMRVVLPQELVISEYFNFDRFGEIVLAVPQPGTDRPFQPTSYLDPSDPGLTEQLDLIRRSRITLDDARGFQNPDPARHPNGRVFDMDNLFRGGDRVRDVIGVLDYAFGSYRVQPTGPAVHIVSNPRPDAPADVGGDFRIAVFNVLNYFDTLTSEGQVCGPRADQACRGADNVAELERQRAKLVAALTAIDAHVVGLLEIENDADQGALRDLVAALNAAAGATTYASLDTGPIGPDAIRVAFIYQPAVIRPFGAHAVLEGAFLDPNTTGQARNRAALAQTFVGVGGEGAFTAIVNHFKSKGEGCGMPGDDHAIQGNCNRTRTLAAELLLAWAAADPTGSGSADVVLLGDFNGYDHEDPIRTIAAGLDGELGTGDDYTDLLEGYEGEFAYTYVFDGQFGHLDYVFANASLTRRVTGATAWHINADESDLIDYDTTFKLADQELLYVPDPYRSSDHDPVIVGVLLLDPGR